MQPRGAPTRVYGIALAALCALGVAIRLWYVRALTSDVVPFTDAWSYLALGQGLAAGRGYLSPLALLSSGQEVPTVEFPPLFPAVLALLEWLGVGSVEARKAIFAIAGAASILLVSEIARRTLGRAAGLVAAALAALSPSLIESDGALMSETLFVPLVAASLLAALRSGGPLAGWLLPGALVGLASLTRAEALLLVPLLAPGVLCMETSRSRARRIGAAALLAVGAALVVVPWTLRNYLATGGFVPISGSGNGALLGANCDETWREPLIGSWTHRCYERVEPGASELTKAVAYRQAAADFVRAHREQLPAVLRARLERTWGLRQSDPWGANPEGRDWDWAARASRLGPFLLAAAILGSLLPGRPRRGQLLILWAPIALTCLISLGVYGNARFRLLAEPSLLVLTAGAVTGVWRAAVAAARRR